MHNSIQILLSCSPPPPKIIKNSQTKKFLKWEYLIPQTRGNHSLSEELHHQGTGSLQRPLTESRSPSASYTWKEMFEPKNKGVSSPFASVQAAQFHQRSADVSALHCCFLLIQMQLPSPEVWRSWREVVNQPLAGEPALLAVPLPVRVRSPHRAQHCCSHTGRG